MEEFNNEIVKNIAGFLRSGEQTVGTYNPPQAKMYGKLIVEEFLELVDNDFDVREPFACLGYFPEGNDNDSSVASLDACGDLIWVIIGYCLSRGWDIEGAMREITRSNMSKVDPSTGKLIKRADGKILKPATFSEPNLKPFVNGVQKDGD